MYLRARVVNSMGGILQGSAGWRSFRFNSMNADAVLVTADERYLRAAQGKGRIIHVKDWAWRPENGEGGR